MHFTVCTMQLENDVEMRMPRPPSDAVQIAIRVPKEWIKEADELAQLMSKPGFTATRTDAIRAALAKGLVALAKEEHARPRTAEDAVVAAITKFAQRDAGPCSIDVIEILAREAGFDSFDVDLAMTSLSESRRIEKSGSGWRLPTRKRAK